MKQVEQLDLPLWEVLQEAAIAPDAADLQQLLDVLDESLSNLDPLEQLQVAAEAIAQIVQMFQDRSALAFEELEATNRSEGPVMPEDAFDRYVRQTMEVDFEQFIQPIESLPRKSPERFFLPDEQDSVVDELDQVVLLQALDEQMSQRSELTEVEVFNQVLEIAYDEDVLIGVKAIDTWMECHRITAIPLVGLQQAIGMPLIQLWLTLLLGGYFIEQRGEFYENGQIWILSQSSA